MKKLMFGMLLLFKTVICHCQVLDSAIMKRFVGKTVHFRAGDNFRDVKILIGVTKTIETDNTLYDHYTASFSDSIAYRFGAFSYSDSLTNKEWNCVEVLNGDPGYVFLKLTQKNNRANIIYYYLSTIYGGAVYTDEDLQKNEAEENREKLAAEKKRAEQEAELDNPCSQIDYMYDDFHYSRNYNTSIELPQKIADTSYEKYFNAVFYKQISHNHSVYYLSLNTTSSIPGALRRGVIVILKNGKRINKPLAKVETTVEEVHDEATYVVKSFISLNSNDIALLRSSPLNEFELYSDQDQVRHSDIVYKMFLCLLTKK